MKSKYNVYCAGMFILGIWKTVDLDSEQLNMEGEVIPVILRKAVSFPS